MKGEGREDVPTKSAFDCFAVVTPLIGCTLTGKENPPHYLPAAKKLSGGKISGVNKK